MFKEVCAELRFVVATAMRLRDVLISLFNTQSDSNYENDTPK